MLYPAKEWEVIAVENKDRKTIFMQFVLPLLCLVTLASIIGSLLFASRMVFSFKYVICNIAILWCSLSVGLYLSSFVVTEITARKIGWKDHDKSFALMAYASSAVYLVLAIVQLFPFFNELLVLGFYSCYLYWVGIPFLIQAQGQKQMIFVLLSFIIVALVFSLVFYFFGNVISAIFV